MRYPDAESPVGVFMFASRWLLLISLAAILSAAPSAFDAFEVATIKPTPPDWTGRFFRMQTANQFVARGYQLRVLIAAAYNLNPKAVAGDLHGSTRIGTMSSPGRPAKSAPVWISRWRCSESSP